MIASPRFFIVLLCLVATQVAVPVSTRAQQPDVPDRLRFGISLGGTHRIGLSVEYLRDDNSVELSVGAFQWDLVSIGVVGRRYFGERRARPYAGVGLWSMVTAPGDDFGFLTFLRVPIGVDWNPGGNHYAGLEASLNYAFAVNRLDPDDRSALRRHFLPLPAVYYKFQETR